MSECLTWEEIAEAGYALALELGLHYAPRWVECDVERPEHAWCDEEDDLRADQNGEDQDEDFGFSDIDPDTYYQGEPLATSEADEAP